ncbi:MAG: diphthamide synthesis protein [Candidatus Woesearchaeota archaeon]|nr:diphthamide synthesis protein [Nanoarchaeota archaeon]MBU1623064.1 diphthamide synthesis protein [Nanoarchaeota archaeon]MBU1974755.1 diphthamide synthesis protein [Nanoarchaeota archaeon]
MYDLELDRIVKEIKAADAKLVCLQLPDGLKPRAKEIEAEINSKTSARVLIWLGSCYGACDLPLGLERLGVDLVLSFGHNQFRKEEW